MTDWRTECTDDSIQRKDTGEEILNVKDLILEEFLFDV